MLSTELLGALPVAVYTTDAEGWITYYNEAAAELWGHRPELGTTQWCGCWKIYWPDGRPLPHDQCPMALTLKEGRPVRGVEAIAERPDGTRVNFLPFPTPLRDASGRLTGAINLLMDITERHADDLHAAQLAAIVATSDDAIVSKTLEGRVTSWNAAATRLFGYAPEEMIGQSIIRIIPPELHDEEGRILAQLRRGEHIDHYETVRRRNDGGTIYVSLSISPMRNAASAIVGASKIARDITARRDAEKALARHAEEQAALYEFTDRLYRTESLAVVYDAAIDAILVALRCSRASIQRFDQRGVMRFVAWRGLSDTYRQVVEDQSPWPREERNPEPVCVEDAAGARFPKKIKKMVAQEGIGAPRSSR